MTDQAQHLTCQEVVELVTDYLETTLSADEVALFEQHILACEGCMRYVDQMRLTVLTAGRLGTEDVPVETRDRLLAVFRDWKRR